MKNVVSKEWLIEHLNENELIICDCRFDLSDPAKGRNEFEAGHITGAIYVDLEQDLSGKKHAHGGRHPLPDMDEFIKKLGEWGIDETKTVVMYDDNNGSNAARFWWMLKYVGHEKAYVLQGGFTEWEKSGFPISKERTRNEKTVFTAKINHDMIASMEDVKRLMDKKSNRRVIVDSRDEKRYRGEVEPIDKLAGHIPAAVNVPWVSNFEKENHWKSSEELSRLHSSLKDKEEVIVYCGSGVTACSNVLGMDEAGIQAKLYVGSWSDWISYPENKIEKGKND
ncbi:sulfurtransferase [Fictibacillus gelatini]|uniref:sulfurtransferase n=1 Tax=Fictibacillus gelatini TaxID=225985 RepID=UPI0004294F93|nr:sulfurtransferase [Fictibacillus gelatini]